MAQLTAQGQAVCKRYSDISIDGTDAIFITAPGRALLGGWPGNNRRFRRDPKNRPPKKQNPQVVQKPSGDVHATGDVHAISSRKFSVMGEAAGEDQATVSKQG